MPTNAEIDMYTGVLTFTPTALGRFTFCVKVEEWHRSDLGEVAYAGSVSYEVSIPVESLVSINEPTLLDRVNMHYDHAALSIGFVASGVQGSVELRVYDGLGRLVVRDEIIPTMPFSVSDLPKGAYTATLNSQSGISLAGLHFIR
jgi:hypothetical protein